MGTKFEQTHHKMCLAKKGIKRRSTSLVIREIQIKATMKSHSTSTRVAQVIITDDSKC